MFLLLGVVLVFFVQSPWNVVALLVSVALFVGERSASARKRLDQAICGLEPTAP